MYVVVIARVTVWEKVTPGEIFFSTVGYTFWVNTRYGTRFTELDPKQL